MDKSAIDSLWDSYHGYANNLESCEAPCMDKEAFTVAAELIINPAYAAMYSALEHAADWISSAPHGDNCFIAEGEHDRCICGKDAALDAITEAQQAFGDQPQEDADDIAWDARVKALEDAAQAADKCVTAREAADKIRCMKGFQATEQASQPQSLAELESGIAAVTEPMLREELKDMQATFDLRWKADMRAIAKWREQTGKELVMPDHADLCIWLLERLEQASQPQWIPTSEQLPEEAAPVLVPYHPIPIAAYWDRGPDLEVRWWKFGVPNAPIETRYWMRLPSQSGI